MINTLLAWWRRRRAEAQLREATDHYAVIGHSAPIAAAYDELAMTGLLQRYRDHVSFEYLTHGTHPDETTKAWLKIWGPAAYKAYGRVFGASLKKTISGLRPDEMLNAEALTAWRADAADAARELEATLAANHRGGVPPELRKILG